VGPYSPTPKGMPMLYGLEIFTSKINTKAALSFFSNIMKLKPTDVAIMWPTVVETSVVDKITGKSKVTRVYYTFDIIGGNTVEVFMGEVIL